MVAVCQSSHPVVQNVSLVVKSQKTHLCHFDGVQNVIGKFKHSKFGLCGGRCVLQNVEETFVTDILFHIILLYPLDLFL